MAWGYKL